MFLWMGMPGVVVRVGDGLGKANLRVSGTRIHPDDVAPLDLSYRWYACFGCRNIHCPQRYLYRTCLLESRRSSE